MSGITCSRLLVSVKHGCPKSNIQHYLGKGNYKLLKEQSLIQEVGAFPPKHLAYTIDRSCVQSSVSN